MACSKVSGRGNVDFSDANSSMKKATFQQPGIYKLHLIASDGTLQREVEVTFKGQSLAGDSL